MTQQMQTYLKVCNGGPLYLHLLLDELYSIGESILIELQQVLPRINIDHDFGNDMAKTLQVVRTRDKFICLIFCNIRYSEYPYLHVLSMGDMFPTCCIQEFVSSVQLELTRIFTYSYMKPSYSTNNSKVFEKLLNYFKSCQQNLFNTGQWSVNPIDYPSLNTSNTPNTHWIN